MLTQIQIAEPQAAVLAACPRPRAVTPAVLSNRVLSPLMPSSSPAWVGVVRLGAVSEVRRGRLMAERTRAFGFAAATRPAGYAAAARVIGAGVVGSGSGSNGTTGSKKDQQDKQHLTDRRGPVTWRPPH
ncbi:hypothetical protein [Actinospica sp.]|uniref:hypothetical protein n=1 Tax=Actinospica sp. TaxID=1872142 RepID=UPI002C8427A7|nr:hypothetical protein [Actinospica sp.]HWG24716.1 hypothetical protein [Actinospica sp.]